MTIFYSQYYTSSHFKEADEIRCPYNQLGLILKDITTQRLNITVPAIPPNTNILEKLSYIPSTIDYTVSTTSITQLKKFLSEKIPAYYAYPVSDWEFFNKLQKAGVSDIVISGPIAFSAETLFRQKQSTKIRVPLYNNPYSLLDSAVTPDSFYIRPEDTKYYTAIDYIEFPIEKEEALFSIYKKEEFLAEISYLVPNITPDIKNALLPEDFAKRRLNCGRRCDTSGSCHYCETQFKIAELTWEIENDNRNN